MKIVLEIQHPVYKITVFKSGFRHIVKFDRPDLDFAFKFQDGHFDNLQQLEEAIEQRLLPQADGLYEHLSNAMVHAFVTDDAPSTDSFPNII